MTEEHLDRMVRDADPYRPDVIGRLEGAKQALLEEIMSEPTLDRVAEAPQPRSRARRGLVRRLAGPLTAAAALVGLIAVSTMFGAPPGDRQAAPGGTSAGPTAGPATSVVYSPVALKAAEQNPRLLIDEPGWRVITVYGFAEKQGTIAFGKGGRQFDMNWYPADQYDGYHADRRHVSAPEAVKVDGWDGDLFRYSSDDFAVMLRPRDGVFVELRAGGGNRTEFDRTLTHVVRVDVRTWLAALPPEIVTPARVEERATVVLADIPLPPDFDKAALAGLGTNDAYQFGAQVTSRIGCAWIAEWQRAKRAGDDAALRRAADALRSSHNWKVLHQMKDEGDWPEVFWETADKVVAGDVPRGYDQALGCG
ncbi:hypothetical protein RMN56_02180 [Micromonospora halotolerans]|uniref:Uncharacterized protein n=1 Tax=Micromonospora halotolerans TaxID=709879 RepID=A0ABY9ZY13_9ACTN|nr:hypothetical protein [Micromonospora halotolerans]WNM40194.1 hypothetical protein RMN56_02180 [Micromonospora halotolerans]